MNATDDLRGEHHAVTEMLEVLEGMTIASQRGTPLPVADLRQAVEFLQTFVDRCHHHKEERLLFPRMQRVAGPATRRLIEQLLAEHEEGRGYVRLLAGLTEQAEERGSAAVDDGPAREAQETMAAYVTLLRQHTQAEDERLFPEADATLSSEEQDRLAQDYEKVEEEVIGEGRHEALHASLEGLLERYVQHGS